MKVVFALIYMIFLTSCTSVSITDRKQLMILGDDVIYPEAFKAYKDFKSKTRLIESGKELDEINQVTNKLKTAIKNYYKSEGQKDPTSNFAWEIVLVDNKEVKNAWCMPGGKMAVYSGILEIANNEVFNIKSHRVKYGENLSLIAKKYQVPMKDIISYNKISNPDRIKPKTYLQIPINYELYLQQEANKRKKIYHTVKRGDTVSEIAELYKTSAKNIKKWNGLRTDVIRLGQKLEIWVKATNTTNYTSKKKSSRTYKVRYGDTLSEIAEKYGIGLSKIKKWNNINSSDDIREGQILKISPPY